MDKSEGTGEAFNASVSTEGEVPERDLTYKQTVADAAVKSAKRQVEKEEAALVAVKQQLANVIAEREALN